jgi:hypothetical protein
MAILLQQDFSQPNDEKGMRDSIKPQHIRSGTYFNQMQLRGSILVIKDNLNTESGYLAFGSSMSTIPTSPTTGTGIYIDYRGIYGMSSGTPQFTLDASTGAITAISGTIGGWTITSTALSNAGGTVTMRGAGNLAFGATPPTSATVGTGIFINNAGVYGLASNTQQFYLQASDGKAYAGAGAVILDSSGVTITGGNGAVNTLKWKDSTNTILTQYAYLNGTTTEALLQAAGKNSSNRESILTLSAVTDDGAAHAGTGAVSIVLDTELDGGSVHISDIVYADGGLWANGSFTSPGIDDNANAVAITIDSSEFVGIGTTSPSFNLDIRASSGFPMLGVGKLGANEYMNFQWDVTNTMGLIQTTSRAYEVRVDASLFKVHTNNTLRLTIANGGVATFASEVEIDGALNHDGSTVGFYGVTPASRPSAYTQTYSTATRTHAALTSTTLTNSTGETGGDIISDVGGSFDQSTINVNFASLLEQVNALRVDVTNVKGICNSMIDDRQADGLAQ